MKKPIYLTWWFWVAFILLVFAAWHVRGYVEWRAERVGDDARNALSYMYSQYLKSESERLEEAYRNDQYGGATPEETLRLYVEALEVGNAELASKYFIPENQKKELERYDEGVKSGGLKAFVNAYRNGRIVPPDTVGSSGIYEFELFEPNREYPFRLRLIQNEFTSKWKIIE